MERGSRDARAATLQGLLVQSHIAWEGVLEDAWQHGRRTWFARMLDHLLVLAAGQDFAYVESKVGDNEDTIVILAFTDSRIIRLEGEVDVNTFRATARPRRPLLGVEMLDLRDTGRDSFPSSIALRLTYPDLDPIELGRRTDHNGDASASTIRLAAFYPSLLADLTAR